MGIEIYIDAGGVWRRATAMPAGPAAAAGEVAEPRGRHPVRGGLRRDVVRCGEARGAVVCVRVDAVRLPGDVLAIGSLRAAGVRAERGAEDREHCGVRGRAAPGAPGGEAAVAAPHGAPALPAHARERGRGLAATRRRGPSQHRVGHEARRRRLHAVAAVEGQHPHLRFRLGSLALASKPVKPLQPPPLLLYYPA